MLSGFVYTAYNSYKSNLYNTNLYEEIRTIDYNSIKRLEFTYDRSNWGDGRDLDTPFLVITDKGKIAEFMELINTLEITSRQHPRYIETWFIRIIESSNINFIKVKFEHGKKSPDIIINNGALAYKADNLYKWFNDMEIPELEKVK